MHEKILDAWEKVEERYSDCYENLNQQNNTFKEIKKQMTESFFRVNNKIDSEHDELRQLIYDFMKPWEVDGLDPEEDDDNPFINPPPEETEE